MLVDTVVGQVFICDVCGENSHEHKAEQSFFSFEHNFFYEEPSFGSGSESEGKLHEHCMTLGEQKYDKQQDLAIIAQTKELVICQDCYENYEEENYFSQFDKALRQRRGEILLEYIRAGRLLPGFSEESKFLEERKSQLERQSQELKEKLVTHIKEGRPHDWIVDKIVAIQWALNKEARKS